MRSELRAPVADVVVRDDGVAEETPDARERVAEDRRADVADVHRLCDIRRREVHDEPARCDEWRAEPIIRGERGKVRADRGGLQAEIDEPCACDLRRLAQVVHLQLRDDLGRELARVCAAGLRELHGHVRLVVAEARVLRGLHGHGDAVGVAGCGGEPRCDDRLDGFHEKRGRHLAARCVEGTEKVSAS
jgi:hypothetical protein